MEYKFTVLAQDEFNFYIKTHPQASFMQTVELGNLKKEFGVIPHYLGVKKANKIVAATLILEEPSILKKKSFYAPRGYLIDYENKELLSFFCKKISMYVKRHNGFRIIIDPNVIYRVRSSEGDIISEECNSIVVDNLVKLGYKHFGFNKYLETLQARWEYRLNLDKSYEEIKSCYSKSTRKNIDNCFKKGIRVRNGKIEDLPTLASIFDVTSKRKDFNSRSLEYYQKMYKYMHELMTIYIAYIDPKIYLESSLNNLEEEKKNNEKIKEKMQKDMVGNKLKNQKETSDKLIGKYKLEVEKAKEFRDKNPNGKDIGVLLSMKSGEEYLTLSSGMLEEYKSFLPKYAMYDHHVKDAIKNGYKVVDFYGIVGDFDKNGKYYGIYEIKKGFNGNVVELVGQFEKTITWFNYVYKIGRFALKIIKKTKNKKI